MHDFCIFLENFKKISFLFFEALRELTDFFIHSCFAFAKNKNAPKAQNFL